MILSVSLIGVSHKTANSVQYNLEVKSHRTDKWSSGPELKGALSWRFCCMLVESARMFLLRTSFPTLICSYSTRMTV